MKKLLATTLALCMVLGLSACGGNNQASEPEPPKIPDLTGTWKQVNSNSEDAYQTAVIKKDSITIDWVIESENATSIYWAGNFVPPTTADEPYKWESANDKSKTGNALLASVDDTKMFSYQDGKITYNVSMMDVTITVELEKESSDVPAESETADSEYFFKDNVLLTNEVKIEITDYKIIPAGEGMNEYGSKPILAFWYDTTNISGIDIDASSAWIYSVSAIQDNDPNSVNDLDSAFITNDEYADSSMQTIKKDGKVTAVFAYELDDETTPVLLTATNGMLGEELGTQEFIIAD